VKDTYGVELASAKVVEDTIQNRVKETKSLCGNREGRISNTIENCVKETREVTFLNQMFIEETIINGIKETK